MNNKNLLTGCFCFFILSMVIIGCSEENSKNISKENSSQEVISSKTPSTKTEKVKIEDLPSGGLGLELPVWEQLHGPGTQNQATTNLFYSYEEGKYFVQYTKIKSGNVRSIERTYGDRDAVTINEAREESRKYIPKDAKFVRSYTSSGGSTVDLYASEYLKKEMTDDSIGGGKPGEFIIIYRNLTGRTTSFIVATGNNP